MDLYKWQQEAIERAKLQPYIALFAECGIGKSRCAVEILRHLFNKEKRVYRTLIFGPQAVLYNWQDEILKWSKIPEEHIFVSTGVGKKRYEQLDYAIHNKSIIIINYEALRSEPIVKYLKDFDPNVLICDESHKLKSHKSLQNSKFSTFVIRYTYFHMCCQNKIIKASLDVII